MRVVPSRSHCGLESLYIDNLIAISKAKACSNLVLQIRVAPIAAPIPAPIPAISKAKTCSNLVLQIRVAPIPHRFRHRFRAPIPHRQIGIGMSENHQITVDDEIGYEGQSKSIALWT